MHAYFPHRNRAACYAYAIVVLAAHPAAAARLLTRALPRLPILVLRKLACQSSRRSRSAGLQEMTGTGAMALGRIIEGVSCWSVDQDG